MAERTVVTKVSNAVQYSDGTIKLENVRASYPHLDKPFAKADKDGNMPEPKYSMVAMLPKATHEAAKDLCVKVIKDIMSKEDTKVAKDKWFIKDGDESDKNEYEGHWTVSTREGRRPSVRDRKGNVMSEKEIANTFQAGCRVNILIRPWFQDNDFGKRVNAGLMAVQYIEMRDGEQIGEGFIDDEGVFDSLDDDNDGFSDDEGL